MAKAVRDAPIRTTTQFNAIWDAGWAVHAFANCGDAAPGFARTGREGLSPDKSIFSEKLMVIKTFLARQFQKPSGWIGRIVGQMMAGRASDRMRTSWTVTLMGVKPDDRVLEIGCGPGLGVADVAARLDNGFVIGIDHSEEMIEQAIFRNQTVIRNGRAEINLRSVDDLPSVRGGFTKIFGVNVVQFLDDHEGLFVNISAGMTPGGILAMTYQPRLDNATREDAVAFGDRLAASFAAAGFVDIRMEELDMRPAPAICVLGRKPGESDRS